jgi:hypothetical protein
MDMNSLFPTTIVLPGMIDNSVEMVSVSNPKAAKVPYNTGGEIDRRATYQIRKDLYLGHHQRVYFGLRKPRYHYLVVNWISLIPDTWARLLFANFPEISAPAEAGDGAGDAISDLVVDLNLSTLCRASSIQASWAEAVVWKVNFSRAQQRVVITQVEPVAVTWEHDPDDPNTPIAASYWFVKTARIDNKEEKFIIRERQALKPRSPLAITLDKMKKKFRARQNERVREHVLAFTYEAYRTTTVVDGTLMASDQVDLDTVYANLDTPMPAPQPFTLPLDALTLIYIPNKREGEDWRGISDLSDSVVSIQGEANDRASLNKHILDAHSKPTLIIPDDLIVDGMVAVENLDWLTAKQDGSGRCMYVEWSGEMGASFEQLKWLWEQLMSITGLSTTLSTASVAMSGRAREMELVAPIAEVRARRPGWEDAIQRAIYLAMCLEKINKLSVIEPVRNVRIVWPTVLPDSQLDTANATAILHQAGAISLEMMIRKNNPTWSDAEVFAEEARIQREQQQAAEQAAHAAQQQVEGQKELALQQHRQNLEAMQHQARIAAHLKGIGEPPTMPAPENTSTNVAVADTSTDTDTTAM